MSVKILIVGAAALGFAMLATLAATVFTLDHFVAARRAKIEKQAKIEADVGGETAG
jgi:hypothetical protein